MSSSVPQKKPNLFSLLTPYRWVIVGLVVLAIASNAFTLVLPTLISKAIDSYTLGTFNFSMTVLEFGLFTLGIFLFTYLQSIVQTYASERVARDLRMQLVAKISHQSYRFIDDKTPAKLLTMITSDIDSIKTFVAQAIVSVVSSLVTIVGAAIILLVIDWRLALVVLTIIPIIGATFFFILKMVRALFLQSREVIDWLNRVISESITGAALIRVLNSGHAEYEKFTRANDRARAIGTDILKLFSFMIPVITFVSSMATLAVVTLGGYYVVQGSMTLGSFAAFNGYIMMLIFPILIIGFMSNIIAQASASYGRVQEVLSSPDEKDEGTSTDRLTGQMDITDVQLAYGEKTVLKNVSFSIASGTKTAIIGPTAAGKTQLLNVLTGLTVPQSGAVLYDGRPISEYQREALYAQMGLVFQDSVLFNTSVRENIAFSTTVTDESLAKAIETAEIADFLHSLPHGLDTVISERGTSLSGGQKQRLMLARALAINPTILFLDDFTARVDSQTERKILENVARNYPHLTLISITQKIAPIESYDQIIVLMEGEVLARGTHEELMHSSPEYVQIFDSQRSTNTYELRT